MGILRSHPAQPQELLLRQTQREAQRFQVFLDQVGRKAIVARVHRRVRGEHRGLRHVLGHLPEICPGFLHAQTRVLERGESAVALVEVKPAPVDARGTQSADTAHAQEKLLPDAHALVAEIQPRSQFAVLLRIAVHVGVEEQELVASHIDLPDLREQALAAERHLDDDGLAVPA